MKRLTFLKINEFEEYEPDVFCTVQYNEVKAQTHVIQTRCNTLARHVKKIHKMLDVCSETETNQQWDGYRIAIGNYLAEALILSVGRYVVTTESCLIFHGGVSFCTLNRLAIFHGLFSTKIDNRIFLEFSVLLDISTN